MHVVMETIIEGMAGNYYPNQNYHQIQIRRELRLLPAMLYMFSWYGSLYSVDPGTRDPGTGDPRTRDPGTGDPRTRDPGTGDPRTWRLRTWPGSRTQGTKLAMHCACMYGSLEPQ